MMSDSAGKMQIEFVPRHIQHSEYDWADLSLDGQPVGKVRCQINNQSITIFSINVYPEWKNHGFGRQFVEYCITNFHEVIADRVRPTAVGFWKAMGFLDNNDCIWVFRKVK